MPGKPQAPTVSAATPYSLTVEWTEPENTGTAITDYDVQYREVGNGGFTDARYEGTALRATLTGLSPATDYEVQVRASNATGTGAWSESGEGMTSPLQTGGPTYYFPHLAVGDKYQTTITYINYSPQEVTCQTDFLSDQGSPLMVSFADKGTVMSRIDVLDPGGSVHQETNAELSAPLAPGWARATCTGPVKASLLFRLHDSAGMPVAEAGVNAATVAATRFVTFAEQGEGQPGTGVAYANPSDTEAVITFTARAADGEMLASVDKPLLPNGHGAQNMAPLFGLSSFTGSLEVTSTAPIVSLSINAEAAPVFSSLPSGELDAGSGGTAITRTSFESSTPEGYTAVTLATGGVVWGVPARYTSDSDPGTVVYMLLGELKGCDFANAEADRRSKVYIKTQSLGTLNDYESKTVCRKTSSRWLTSWSGVRITLLLFFDESSPSNTREAAYNETTEEYSIDTSTHSGEPDAADIPGEMFAPADEAAFNDLFVGKRAATNFPTVYADFVSPGRFRETQGADTYTGSYTYQNTGSNTGTVTFNYDDGDRCTTQLTFASAMAGTATFTCNDGSSGAYTWQLVEIPASGGDSFGVGDTLPGVPTAGQLFPVSGWATEWSGVTFSGTTGNSTTYLTFDDGGYIQLQTGTRYTCQAAGGCRVGNGVIIRGTMVGSG